METYFRNCPKLKGLKAIKGEDTMLGLEFDFPTLKTSYF